ncbi:hypothetical protein ACM66B_004803 [Microbotryomycetes sp. NB124-2]
MSRRGTPRRHPTSTNDNDDNESRNKNSPSTPTRKSSTTATAAATAVTTPNARGPTPLTQETSFHKRTRALVVEHRRLRREYNELVVRGLVQRTRTSIELWQELETALKHIDARDAQASDVVNLQRARAGYVLAQSKRLQDHIATIDAVLDSLTTCVQSMTNVCDKAENLVIEASKLKGHVFAFREPLWVTWPLNKFADGLQSLTTPYQDSLVLTESLLDTLLTFPQLPVSQSTEPSKLDTTTTTTTSETTFDNQSQSIESLIDATRQRRQRLPAQRPGPETIQACMSMLAVQPLLPSKDRQSSSEAWDELISVEMP